MEAELAQSHMIPKYNDDNYAVVDLGSNSFHLLITCLKGNNIEVVAKVKQKVRLAAGLNESNKLNDVSMTRGLECLSLFAKHLSSIPNENITIVATATLRIATNADTFIQAANKILPKDINLLTGEQEAQTIYAGVAYTCNCDKPNFKRLVLDIGGASTEMIVGEAFSAKRLISLNIGCVSYKQKYFADGLLNKSNFNQAIEAASMEIQAVANDFIVEGWQSVVGSSGTMQALAEILRYRHQEVIITTSFLAEIQQTVINCKHIDTIAIEGLREDRLPVFASGLAILIALFNCLQIDNLQLSTGALREGLLFSIIPNANLVTFVK